MTTIRQAESLIYWRRFALALCAFALLTSLDRAAWAVVIGEDSFSYADGSINNLSGGTGFNYDNLNKIITGTTADYEASASVSGGVLVTEGTNAFREYNGPSEGVGSDGSPTDERLGAFRGQGVVYYSVDLTRTEGQSGGDNWGGISSFDFGTEKAFFGVTGGQGANPRFGLSGGGTSLSSIIAADNTTYRLVTALDFDTNQLRLWVDPDATDFDFRGGGNSADAVLTFTDNSWSSELRLASGNDARSEWDNLRVANTFAQASDREIIFADSFNKPNGTLLDNSAPDVGGPWDITTGGGSLDIQGNTVDTSGGARVAFASFTRALGSHEILVLDFETLNTAGTFHSGGFAGISLFVGGSELVFLGDLNGTSTDWGLAGGAFGGSMGTDVTGEAMSGKFVYSYDSGSYALYLNGALELSGSATPGLAFDRIRFANDNGGDLAVGDLVVSIIAPEPSSYALGAIGVLGIAVLLRRRRK